MSFIKPRTYFRIAEKMAESYSRLRDAFNDGSALTDTDSDIPIDDPGSAVTTLNSNDFFSNMVKHIVEETDDDSDLASNIPHDVDRDPPGSVAKDLGSKFSDFGNTFTEAEAKIAAASFFSVSLKALNTHVLARTPLPPDPSSPPQGAITTMRTINEYYQAYDDDPRAYPDLPGYEMSLFTFTGGGDYFSDATYFSDNFVELSSEIGVTIKDTFKQSFWS